MKNHILFFIVLVFIFIFQGIGFSEDSAFPLLPDTQAFIYLNAKKNIARKKISHPIFYTCKLGTSFFLYIQENRLKALVSRDKENSFSSYIIEGQDFLSNVKSMLYTPGLHPVVIAAQVNGLDSLFLLEEKDKESLVLTSVACFKVSNLQEFIISYRQYETGADTSFLIVETNYRLLFIPVNIKKNIEEITFSSPASDLKIVSVPGSGLIAGTYITAARENGLDIHSFVLHNNSLYHSILYNSATLPVWYSLIVSKSGETGYLSLDQGFLFLKIYSNGVWKSAPEKTSLTDSINGTISEIFSPGSGSVPVKLCYVENNGLRSLYAFYFNDNFDLKFLNQGKPLNTLNLDNDPVLPQYFLDTIPVLLTQAGIPGIALLNPLSNNVEYFPCPYLPGSSGFCFLYSSSPYFLSAFKDSSTLFLKYEAPVFIVENKNIIEKNFYPVSELDGLSAPPTGGLTLIDPFDSAFSASVNGLSLVQGKRNSANLFLLNLKDELYLINVLKQGVNK